MELHAYMRAVTTDPGNALVVTQRTAQNREQNITARSAEAAARKTQLRAPDGA